jgi:hypothetical protein
MKLYSIKDWEKYYEVSDSRKVDGPLSWVAVRTKTDGFGYARITQQRDRTDLLAAWYLMLQIAAKQPKADRGKLSRDGIPLTPDDMELMTRFPAQIFAKALVFFSDPKQAWLTSEVIRSDPDESGQNPEPSEPTPPTGQDRTIQNNKEAASPMSLPFESDSFRTAWELWEKHRREIRKPMTPTAAQMALKFLGNLGEYRAIRCIEHTIAKGWQGLREPDATSPAISPSNAASAQKKGPSEPIGWKAWLNHERPGSVYSAGGDREAHEWGQLDTETQWLIVNEMKKGGS